MLRAIKDGILDGNITSYLLLNIVRVYASGCNNSTHYNLDTMDFWVTFWGLFKVMGICFMRLMRENSSYWGKSFIQYQHQCRIKFAVPSDTTLKKEITQHRNEVLQPEWSIPYCVCVHERNSWCEVVTWWDKMANSICADGDENLPGSDRSPTFEEWKQRLKEEGSNVQLSMDIIKDSYSNTNIIPDDFTNQNIDCLKETFGGACCSRSFIIARGCKNWGN